MGKGCAKASGSIRWIRDAIGMECDAWIFKERIFGQRAMRGFTPNPELLFCQPHKKVTKKSLHDGRLRPLRQVPTHPFITNPASAHSNRGYPPTYLQRARVWARAYFHFIRSGDIERWHQASQRWIEDSIGLEDNECISNAWMRIKLFCSFL